MKSYKTTAEEDYKNNSSINVSILDLFKTPNLRSNVISMILNWGLTSFLFEANFRNVANLPYSIYWTFAIYSLLEFPSDIASIWGLDVIGRRFSAVITLGSFSVMMIICIPLIDDTLLVTIFGTIGRFFIICSMNTALQLRLLEALALRQYLVHSKQAISWLEFTVSSKSFLKKEFSFGTFRQLLAFNNIFFSRFLIKPIENYKSTNTPTANFQAWAFSNIFLTK